MPIPIEVLEAELLSLPPVQRSQLLDRLIASREPDAEWEEAWANEADRREAEVASGKAALLPGDEVIARLRSELS